MKLSLEPGTMEQMSTEQHSVWKNNNIENAEGKKKEKKRLCTTLKQKLVPNVIPLICGHPDFRT